MSFATDLSKFSKKVENNGEKLVRGTALSLFGMVIKLTPVGNPDLWKTKYPPEGYVGGAARGNWQTDINKPASGVIDRIDESGSQALREAVAKTRPFKLGDSIYMVNNLPYIEELENGSSTQAPAGMVKITVNEFQREVNRQARKLK